MPGTPSSSPMVPPEKPGPPPPAFTFRFPGFDFHPQPCHVPHVPTPVTSLVYERDQIETCFDRTPELAVEFGFGRVASVGTDDIYHLWSVRKKPDGDQDAFHLGEFLGKQVSAGISVARMELNELFREVAGKIEGVLAHETDADDLEYHTVLFWPECDRLHVFLGMDPRFDEIIVACDTVRAQFRLRPATAAGLRALQGVFTAAVTAPCLTDEMVDEYLDRLEAAGADTSFPLSFADACH